MKNLFFIIIIFFINIASCFASEEIYYIKNNEVFLENNGNVLELRENAKIISFKKALNILAKNILDPEDFLKFVQISDYKTIDLVSDYKIESEKVTEINYFAKISVNFNEKKVREFFNKNEISLNIFVSESYLIFPIYKKFNTLYLWDKDNSWYDYLLDEYDQQSLLKLYFPKKNNINRLKITADHLIKKNSQKISSFLDFYKKKKAIIIFLEENYNLKENLFNVRLEVNLFSSNSFSKINIGQNKLLLEGKKTSEIELIAKEIINDLQNWWKNKIDTEQVVEKSKNLISISVDTSDLKESFLIEEALKQIVGFNNVKIKELRENNTIYEINSIYSVKHINFGLESKNLKLIKTDMDKNLFSVESY